ncbi:hypothetical protein R1flu_017769 [Riccia fluitans]|uniref:Uncharacterized protein n=1 Tax=Riccia fluitans TaxID=41844 RepID=A0ABD1ZG91_9MARC
MIRFSVTGVTDEGYLISAIVAGQKFPGVLYEVPKPPNQTGQVANMRTQVEHGRTPESSNRQTDFEAIRYKGGGTGVLEAPPADKEVRLDVPAGHMPQQDEMDASSPSAETLPEDDIGRVLHICRHICR